MTVRRVRRRASREREKIDRVETFAAGSKLPTKFIANVARPPIYEQDFAGERLRPCG